MRQGKEAWGASLKGEGVGEAPGNTRVGGRQRWLENPNSETGVEAHSSLQACPSLAAVASVLENHSIPEARESLSSLFSLLSVSSWHMPRW